MRKSDGRNKGDNNSTKRDGIRRHRSVREHSYEWATETAIQRCVNAIEYLARASNQKPFSTRGALWRGDRDALRVEEGRREIVAGHLIERRAGGFCPVDGVELRNGQVREELLGRNPVPRHPEEFLLEMRF